MGPLEDCLEEKRQMKGGGERQSNIGKDREEGETRERYGKKRGYECGKGGREDETEEARKQLERDWGCDRWDNQALGTGDVQHWVMALWISECIIGAPLLGREHVDKSDVGQNEAGSRRGFGRRH